MTEREDLIADRLREVAAAAMNEGWTAADLRDALEQVMEFERDERETSTRDA